MTIEQNCPHCGVKVKVVDCTLSSCCPLCYEILNYDEFLGNKSYKITALDKGRKTAKVRKRIFTRLQKFGYRTPDFGYVKDVILRQKPDCDIVIYHDHFLEKIPYQTISASINLGQKFCSVFVKRKDNKNILMKMFCIGENVYWVDYEGKNWQITKSNAVSRDLLGFFGKRTTMQYGINSVNVKIPVFSVDFILSEFGYLAIDFDVNIGIRGTGIENILTKEQMFKLIREAMNK